MINISKISISESSLSRIDSIYMKLWRIKRFQIFQDYSKAMHWYDILIHDENFFEFLYERNSKLNYESNLLRIQFEYLIFKNHSNSYYIINLMIRNDTSRNFEALKFKSMIMKWNSMINWTFSWNSSILNWNDISEMIILDKWKWHMTQHWTIRISLSSWNSQNLQKNQR